MATRKLISNFSRGEFAPQLYGRVDIPQYEAGAKDLKNFIVQRYGGAAFRPGLRFVAPIFGDITVPRKMVPFQYSIEQSYALILGNADMTLAALGGMIVEEDLKIVSATNAAQVVIEVPFHNYVVGEWLYLTGNSGMDKLNGRFVQVLAVVDASHVRLDINSTAFGALTASTGIVRAGTPAVPPAAEAPPPAPPAPPAPPLTSPPSGGGGSDGDSGAGTLPGYKGGGAGLLSYV